MQRSRARSRHFLARSTVSSNSISTEDVTLLIEQDVATRSIATSLLWRGVEGVTSCP